MIGNGKLAEARALARSPEDRALVSAAQRDADAQRRKDEDAAYLARKNLERERARGQKKRW